MKVSRRLHIRKAGVGRGRIRHNPRKRQKVYYKVIIVNDDNQWVATYTHMSLKRAWAIYQTEEKDEHSYRESHQYYVFGVEKVGDQFYPVGDDDEYYP